MINIFSFEDSIKLEYVDTGFSLFASKVLEPLRSTNEKWYLSGPPKGGMILNKFDDACDKYEQYI